MEKLGINLGFLIFQVLNFLILLIVLYAWLYKPVLGMLEKRKTKIAQGLEDARVAAEARANAEKEAAKILADAQAEGTRRLTEATAHAEQAATDVRAAAEAERARILQAAQGDAKEERNRILADLRPQVAALAMAAANKIVGESLDAKRQKALVEEFFSGIKDSKVVLLEEADLAGEAAEVVSALPLSKTEERKVKEDITSRLGKDASVSFRVDPDILGGLIIRVGDRVIDGSVAGKLESLKHTLR
jgi:F-type H+-transporting ATPase subunit b